MALGRGYVEFVDVLRPVALDGHGELPVTRQAGGRGDELPDNDVLLEAGEAVHLALDGGVGKDAGRLLEGGCREEAVGGERGLGYAHQHRMVGGGASFLFLDAGVLGEHRKAVGDLLGEQRGVAGVVHDHLAEHLADDNLDVLVVDVHALRAVDLLHLVDQVALRPGAPAVVAEVVLQDLMRVDGPFRDRGVGPDLGALDELGPQQLTLDRVGLALFTIRRGDNDLDLPVGVGLLEGDYAVDIGEGRLGLGMAGLEELDHPGQTGRDVLAGDTAGVEGTHGELGSGLPDRLGRDDTHGLAHVDGPVGRERPAVAGLAHAVRALALGGRAHGNERLARQLLAPAGQDARGDIRTGLCHQFPRLRVHQVPGQESCGDRVVRVAPAAFQVERKVDVAVRATVLVVDDDILGDVDEATGQVPRVGGTQGRVGLSLPRAVCRGEVLEHREALHEVALHGLLDDLALRVRHQAAHARELGEVVVVATGPRVGHHVDRVQAPEVVLHRLLDLVFGLGPQPDHALEALLVGDEALVPLLFDLIDQALVTLEYLLFLLGHDDVVLADRDAGLGGRVEPDPLESVEELADQLCGVTGHVPGDEVLDLTLLQRVVDVGIGVGIVGVAEVVPQGLLDVLVEKNAPEGGLDPFAAPAGDDLVVDLERPLLVGGLGLVVRGDERLDLGLVEVLGAEGDVVKTQHHVLRRNGDREPVGGQQYVLRREHEDAGLGLRLGAKRHVHGHLVAVEVRVEGGTDERMDLDGLALHEHGLEGLDAEAVERRRAVQEHGVLLDDVLEDVPHFRTQPLHHLLGAPDVRRQGPVHEHLHHERLEELDGHKPWQATLVHLETWAYHDHRATGVVHALAEQVLSEAALLALEHVGEALERAVTRARHRAAPSSVIEEGVDGLLEHPLLVVDDHVGCAEVEEAAKPVVPVYDPAVEIVEVGGGETATVELDHRTQVRRQDGDSLHDHPFGAIAANAEGIDDLEAFDRLLALLSFGGAHDVPQALGLVLEIDLAYEIPYGLGAHPAAEVHPVAVLVAETVLHFAEEFLVVHDLARLEGLELLPGLPDEPYLLGHGAAYVRDGLLGLLVDLRYGRLAVLLGYFSELLGQFVRGALALDYALALGPEGMDLVDLLVPVELELLDLILDPAAEQVYVVGPLLAVDPRDDGAGEVEYPVEFLGADVKQVAHPARHALDEPHVRHGGG